MQRPRLPVGSPAVACEVATTEAVGCTTHCGSHLLRKLVGQHLLLSLALLCDLLCTKALGLCLTLQLLLALLSFGTHGGNGFLRHTLLTDDLHHLLHLYHLLHNLLYLHHLLHLHHLRLDSTHGGSLKAHVVRG